MDFSKDCVKRDDNTFVCWDDDRQSYRVISAKDVPAAELSTNELSGLVKLMAKKNRSRGSERCAITPEEAQQLMDIRI
ncbi:MAG: hypothetical protein FWB85_05760 [Chitinispirillia bacterium]|nr:hypothetical protein [Chitinispirillia bacterium]